MSDIGTAYVRIEPTAQGISGKIEKEMGSLGTSSGNSFNAGFGKVLGGIGKATLGIATAAGAGLTALGAGVVNSSKEVATYGDNIDKMSQKLGLSATAYQEWSYVLGQAGTSIDNMSTGLKTMTNKLDDAKNGSAQNVEMFKKLGLSTEDLNKMNREEVFAAVIKGFQGMSDSTERAALANDIFGKSGQELTPLFNTTSAETQELMNNAKELGFVLSDDMVSASADYSDALDTLQHTMGGLKNNLMGEFLPSITTVMDGLTQIFAGDTDKGLGMINEGVNNLVNGLVKAIPKIANIAGGILETIGKAIIQNLPMLMKVAQDILLKLVDFIVDNLPALIEAGMQIILELAKGISESLPTLIPRIVEVVLTIVEYLINNVDLLIEASLQLILGLANGLIAALPVLIQKTPEIIIAIVEGLIKNAPLILQAAIQLIVSLVQGIIQALPQVVTATINLIATIVNTLKNKFPEFLSIGKSLIGNLINGITSLAGSVHNAMVQIFNTIGSSISNLFSTMRSWGRDLISSFVNGIWDKIGAVKDAISNVASTIRSYIHFSEPDVGPLADFSSYAPDMVKLFAQGLDESENILQDQMTATFAPPSLESEAQNASTYAAYNPANETGGLYELLAQYLPLLEKIGETKVMLEGDADRLFRVVRTEANKFTKSTGLNAF